MKTQTMYNHLKKLSILISCINMLVLTNVYAINPTRTYPAKPDAVGLIYKTYKIKVNDTTTLNSWVCLQKDLRKPFVIISGSDSGNMAYFLGQAKALYDLGYNVVLYDYRGFGESSDFKINHDMLYYNEFAEDLKKTITVVNQEFKPDTIVLYGLSMGTIVSRLNLDAAQVKGLILDSFVIDPGLSLERVEAIKKKNVFLPEHVADYSQSNKLKLNKPVLIFSGLKDMVTKTGDYQDFLLKNPDSKMVTANCEHLQSFYSMGKDPNLYMVEVNKFVSKL